MDFNSYSSGKLWVIKFWNFQQVMIPTDSPVNYGPTANSTVLFLLFQEALFFSYFSKSLIIIRVKSCFGSNQYNSCSSLSWSKVPVVSSKIKSGKRPSGFFVCRVRNLLKDFRLKVINDFFHNPYTPTYYFESFPELKENQ